MFYVLAESMGGIIAEMMNLYFIAVLVFSVLAGLLLGALPGFSATMSIAILLPFTFTMPPAAGITMLMGVYAASLCGSAIPAILIQTPGTAASAATVADGYQLTLQGQGLKALGVAMIASAVGGVLSGLALLFISPPLASFSLRFSAPEYFLIACLGLCIIASLAGDSMPKGLLAGALGLAIGVVGLDAVTGAPRMTFGSINLESGINFVPAMIGLFALPQVFSEAEKILRKRREKVATEKATEKAVIKAEGKMIPTAAEFIMLIPTMIRSSIIGIVVGIIPGPGADIGSWISYNEGKRFAKKPELYGKGSLEGITASETANNAVAGGTLIPLFTLGIPGSAAAAVLMGGLMIHGLVPGHALFTTHATVTYSAIFGFLIAKLLMGIVGLGIAPFVVKITHIPPAVLYPIVVVFSLVGSFAMRNNIFDVYTMFAFGVLGHFMKKADFPTAATVLGMILGSMAEIGFRTSLVMSRGNMISFFFSRPISVVLIVLLVICVGLPIISGVKKKKQTTDT